MGGNYGGRGGNFGSPRGGQVRPLMGPGPNQPRPLMGGQGGQRGYQNQGYGGGRYGQFVLFKQKNRTRSLTCMQSVVLMTSLLVVPCV
jgi:hypothetical protein